MHILLIYIFYTGGRILLFLLHNFLYIFAESSRILHEFLFSLWNEFRSLQAQVMFSETTDTGLRLPIHMPVFSQPLAVAMGRC